ncbi:uncharacterized protein LOC119606608 [Lucilia sericata]|uniref:uncharacterized protein LOC119606608 n=1 Tax=Lucilia sericata TaxID=13632 RepID=UPI0018A81B5D|nr:uncharacterized protein LOC119606608 [Lucilia sericata]
MAPNNNNRKGRTNRPSRNGSRSKPNRKNDKRQPKRHFVWRGTISLAVAPITTSITKTFVPAVVVQMIMESGNRIARAILNPSLTKSRIATVLVRDTSLKPFTIDNEVFVKVLIGPNLTSNVRYEVCMEVVKDLPKTLYPNPMDEAIKNKVCRISLADPEFYSNKPVSMEIGGDLYTSILQPNVIHIDGGSLIAQDSTLGWLVMGSSTQ